MAGNAVADGFLLIVFLLMVRLQCVQMLMLIMQMLLLLSTCVLAAVADVVDAENASVVDVCF